MKTSLKILLFGLTLVVMTACSAEKRAARRVRRAVALCPELVQTKAHLVDTVLTAPAFADAAIVPLNAVLEHDTVYQAAGHGTFVVSLRPTDSTLRIGFIAMPQEVRYRDTVRYAQVVAPAASDAHAVRRGFLGDFLVGALCVMSGFVLAAYLTLGKRQP